MYVVFTDAEVSGAHAMSELLYRACVVTLWLCPIAIAVIRDTLRTYVSFRYGHKGYSQLM